MCRFISYLCEFILYDTIIKPIIKKHKVGGEVKPGTKGKEDNVFVAGI